MKIVSSNETHLLRYNFLSYTFTNYLCNLAGFENFHSVYHMDIVDQPRKMILVNDFTTNQFLLYKIFNELKLIFFLI